MLTPEEGATFRRLGTELHAIGVNLNQIARALNGGRAVGAREMRATVLDLAAHVSELQESLHHLAGRRRQQARAGVAQAREVDA
ncbi:MAG TPA: plasmid mobilization relaxosome protein MobC [Beijerinckiaceae bacterium]|nr:plasmid mobilization relaxosome protein MobC [Beijerinckiaceae bacterium]